MVARGRVNSAGRLRQCGSEGKASLHAIKNFLKRRKGGKELKRRVGVGGKLLAFNRYYGS